MVHPDQLYGVLAGACGLLAALALMRSFSRLRRDRLIADTPTVRIRSAAQGYVKVEGRAVSAAAATMRAPLSGRACVWWDYRIEYKDRSDERRTVYRLVEKATSVTPFVVTDGDGECLVGPVGAEVTPTANDRWTGYTTHPSGPPPFESTFSLAQGGDYIYHERLIAPGTRLCVLGELRSHTEFGAVDEKTRTLLAQWKHDQPALLRRFDLNHDGHLDAGEWEAARTAAHAQAEGTVRHSPIERVGVIGQTTHGDPFLIAPFDGEHVVRRERRYAIALAVASCLFLTCGIWALSRTQQPPASVAHDLR